MGGKESGRAHAGFSQESENEKINGLRENLAHFRREVGICCRRLSDVMSATVKIGFSTQPLTIEYNPREGTITVEHGNESVAHPFDKEVCQALFAAVAGRPCGSPLLASALSLFVYLLSIEPRGVNRPQTNPIVVTVEHEKLSLRILNVVNAFCAAVLLLVDQFREVGHCNLAALLLSYCPLSRQQVPGDLPHSLGEGAIFSFLSAQRAASFFSPAKVKAGPVLFLRAPRPVLQWLAHYPRVIELLCDIVSSSLTPLHELVSVCVAIFHDSFPEAPYHDLPAAEPRHLADNLVAIALDLAAAREPQQDVVQSTLQWLNHTKFPPSVSALELEEVTHKSLDQLSEWTCGRPPPQTTSYAPTFRRNTLFSIQSDTSSDWEEELIATGRATGLPQKAKKSILKKQQQKTKRGRETDDNDGREHKKVRFDYEVEEEEGMVPIKIKLF